MINLRKKYKYAIGFTVLTILMLLLTLTPITTTYAYSTNISSSGSTLNPSKDQLNGAKNNPKYGGNSEKIYGNISSNQNTDIFHYEAPYQGYYALYADSNMDTVGKVYEHKNFLWWQTRYEELQSNDDGSKITGNNRDFYMVQEFERKEDYFIAVRGYNTNTGSYYLNIEPNKDKKVNVNGGTWNSEKLDMGSANSGVWTDSKQYLTKEEAILLYIYSNPMTRETYGKKANTSLEEIATIYNDDPMRAVDISLTILGLVPGLPYVASLAISAVGWIIDKAMTINSASDSFLETLHSVSGVLHLEDGRITAERGMLIERTYLSIPFSPYNTEYKIFNDNPGELMTGDEYCKGIWS